MKPRWRWQRTENGYDLCIGAAEVGALLRPWRVKEQTWAGRDHVGEKNTLPWVTFKGAKALLIASVLESLKKFVEDEI